MTVAFSGRNIYIYIGLIRPSCARVTIYPPHIARFDGTSREETPWARGVDCSSGQPTRDRGLVLAEKLLRN